MDKLSFLESMILKDVEGSIMDRQEVSLTTSQLREDIPCYIYSLLDSNKEVYRIYHQKSPKEKGLNMGDIVKVRVHKYITTESKTGWVKEITEYEILQKAPPRNIEE